MLQPRRLVPLVLLPVLLVVLAACGDEEPTTVTETVTVEATTGPETAGTTTEADAIADCDDFSFNITGVSARNIGCAEALELMGRELGSVSESFSLGSFECDLIEGIELSGIWRCVDGDRAIRFAFGD